MGPSEGELKKRIEQGLMATGEDTKPVVRAKTAALYLQALWARRAVWLTAVTVFVLALTLILGLWGDLNESSSGRYRFEATDSGGFWRFDTISGEAILFEILEGKYIYLTVNPPQEPAILRSPMPSGSPPVE